MMSINSRGAHSATAFGMFFLSLTALADSAPQSYEYGAKLDVVKVLSITTQDSAACEPVEQTMTYTDSSGETRALQYVVLSSTCSQN